jgi:hypothetical protein
MGQRYKFSEPSRQLVPASVSERIEFTAVCGKPIEVLSLSLSLSLSSLSRNLDPARALTSYGNVVTYSNEASRAQDVLPERMVRR